MCRLCWLVLLLAPGHGLATTCVAPERLLERSEVIASFIPMQGEIVELSPIRTRMRVDVHGVSKGEVYPRETLVLEGGRMLGLGDEYLVVTDRNDDGLLRIGQCTPVIFLHRQPDWINEHLGPPVHEFQPRMLRD